MLLCFCFFKAGSIPSSRQSGCIPELVKVKKGERLSLHCASYCHRNIETPTVYAWWKIDDGGKKVQLSHTGAILSKNIVSPEAGGEYTCKCGESGHLCTYYIAGKIDLNDHLNAIQVIYTFNIHVVLPEVIFSSSQSAAHYGDTLNLSCAVEGYPVTSNTSLITNHYFIKVEEQSSHVLSQYKIQSSATVYDIGEEDYTCSVVIYYKENLVVNEERTLKIKLYSKPINFSYL